MLRGALYLRISKDVEGSGLGVERQETECRRLAGTLGVDVVVVCSDNDTSAYTGKRRPGFDALVEGMRARAFDVVLCWHPDRLTRHPKELEKLIDLLEQTGVIVHTVSAGTYDLATPTGRHMARIVGATARYESEQKAARLRSKFDQMAGAGDAPGGKPPFGFVRVDKGYVVEPAEAAYVCWMADRILEGWSLLAVSKEMAKRQVPTREGGAWHHARVRAILVNPALAGLRIHRRQVVGEGGWIPVLDRDRWELVCGVLADPQRKRRRPAQVYPLSGLLFNASGDRLRGQRKYEAKGDRRTYVTLPHARPFVRVDADELEAIVYAMTLQKFDGADLTVKPWGVPVSETAGIEAELDELARLRGEGVISLREWLKAREPLEGRLADAKRKHPTQFVVPETNLDPVVLRAEWPSMSPKRKRKYVDMILVRVVVHQATSGRWTPIEDRLEPVFR